MTRQARGGEMPFMDAACFGGVSPPLCALFLHSARLHGRSMRTLWLEQTRVGQPTSASNGQSERSHYPAFLKQSKELCRSECNSAHVIGFDCLRRAALCGDSFNSSPSLQTRSLGYGLPKLISLIRIDAALHLLDIQSPSLEHPITLSVGYQVTPSHVSTFSSIIV